MKQIIWVGWLLGAWFLAARESYAAETVDDLHTWNDGQPGAWAGLHSDAVITNTGDHLVAAFAAQTVPQYERCMAWTPIDQSVLVTNLSFTFLADPRVPSELALYLHSRYSDRIWQSALTLPPEKIWTAYTLPLDFTAGWSRGPSGTYEEFRNDVLDIDWVGLFVVRSAGSETMQYGLDDFRVRGWRLTDIVDPPDDSNGNGIPDAWEDRHKLAGIHSTDDDDDDGMSNYAEWRAGTDPTNALSRFFIDAESRRQQQVDVGVAVRWDSIRYREYSVWKSTNLTEGFTRQAANIFCTPPSNEYIDPAATNRGPYFYRVTVEE